MSKKRNSDRLLGFIERVERIELERKALAQDAASIFKDASSVGFDPKVMKAMIRERSMDPARREEWQALLDIYRAALGMLAGTELGAAARKRLMGAKPDAPDAGEPKPDDMPPGEGAGATPDDAPTEGAAPPDPGMVLPTATPEDLIAARAQGAAAAKAGRAIAANPFAAGDSRRAAWDEGWCAASSSDGMDVPDIWRRAKPKADKPPAPPGPGGE